MILLLGWVYAADMAWECRSFTTALEAIDYRDAEADGELSTAYDTLYALLDGNCVATSCGWECEEIVDCTTEAGHLINWFSETTEPWSAGRVTLVQIEVVPAASSGYSWTIAEYTSQTGDYYWPYLQTERATFSYDGDWDGGYPTNGTISRSRWRDDKSGEIDTWDDGTCAWRRSYQDGDGSFRWDLTVNGTDLRVEQWSMGCAADEAAAVDFNGVYVGLVDYRTWEPVTDADLDGSPASLDCDDNDPNRSGCAAENPHDSIDNNCDGVADDGDADDDGSSPRSPLGRTATTTTPPPILAPRTPSETVWTRTAMGWTTRRCDRHAGAQAGSSGRDDGTDPSPAFPPFTRASPRPAPAGSPSRRGPPQPAWTRPRGTGCGNAHR